ncbi:exopolysaccharide biosynthesis polyprenyl glycosylphosphotransferase [Actinomadura opuntiae]|uniref:exopolysaccharide biosynthesis polyprenyl glycosylphosphotransferase n=1 Tax=Actinomadura sp. OS1-43 TaxID=604315 RepID=UPI00255A9F7C|nr:exopolysaccharide biosynthesis polyprenyl glycosylphosphotransferase [Actinomadura sp. OS1-43]MDL4818454.1 exopolysaccharide biosynthesis polyprenyl glycosylphosphotransferase [Actinomadura sp. OS1-43]
MRAQGLSASIDPGASIGAGAPLADPPPRSLPRRHRSPALLAVLYPACLAVADGWAMAAAVSVARGAGPDGALPAAASAAVIVLNAAGGLYRVRRSPSLLADVRPVLVRALVVGALAAALLPVLTPGTAPSRAGTAAWLLIASVAGALSLAVRAFGNAAARTYRCRRSRARTAVVVGTGPMSDHVVDILLARGELGLAPVGLVAAGGPDAAPGPTPVLGDAADLPALVEEHGADTVVIVAEEVRPGRLDAVLRLAFGLPCETLLVQPPSDVVPVAPARREYLAGLPCARVDWRLRGAAPRLAKRALDLAVGALALALAAPVLAACALAVRLEGGPGVLFRQRRIGRGGEEFVLLKFRTLKPADEQESDTRWTVEGDHRMGPVGRFLRRTSLDELPQLWNVVRGDMSLVGPRPERPHFVEQFSRSCPGYMLRHRVPVGMTGWAQVHGFRGDTSIELRARLDNHYIDHWSFGSDLRILLLTVRAMLCRDAA